ncbi:related to dynein light chain type 1 [Rhynchosporium secalis]|uniref:Related to dynein light chain type 1 n=1 Tax=Rhynchosporium secalis TaxID=38038 RepID=A0A1E1MD91_RHYSE|nr:related to dynein light chain type 1 [Rhynchosporium secalis]
MRLVQSDPSSLAGARGLEITINPRGTSATYESPNNLRRVAATTDLTLISSYPLTVSYSSDNTEEIAIQCTVESQRTDLPGECPLELFKMSTTEKKEKLEAQIKSADMTDDMQQEAIDIAQEAMTKFTVEKDIAMHIKKTFDERKGPTWHCIVGRNFGSFVTHETKHFIYFYLGHCAILLFKTQ